MSLLTAINRTCAQAGLPTFDAFYSVVGSAASQGRTATELLALAHEAGEEITRRAEWSQLYNSTTSAIGVSTVALPSDFHRLIQGNAIYTRNGSPVMPVRSFDAWTVISGTPSSQMHYFIQNGLINFAPALRNPVTIRYISKNWILNGSTPTDAFSDDDDTTRFTDTLLSLGVLWRYKRAKGLAYADSQAEFEAELSREIMADRGA